MKTYYIFLIVGLFFAQAHAADQKVISAPFKISVRFDHTFYTLSWNSKLMDYQQSGLSLSLKAEDCSRSVIDRIAGEYWQLRSSNEVPEAPDPQYDVKIYGEDPTKPLSVLRGSPFGNWLRALPSRIPYFKGEAQALCKH